MLMHQFREFGDRSVWTDPIDSLVHHVFDFHDPPPLLDLAHSVKSNPGSLDALDYTTGSSPTPAADETSYYKGTRRGAKANHQAIQPQAIGVQSRLTVHS